MESNISYRELEKLVGEASDLFSVLSPEGKILWVNQASKQITGYSPSEMIGYECREFLHTDDISRTLKTLGALTGGEKIDKFENRFIHKAGREVDLMWLMHRDSDHSKIYCIAKDVSEKKRADTNLLKSEKKHRILFDISPIPKYIFILETLQIVDVNQAAVDHYGYSKEEFLAMNVKDMRPEGEIPHLMNTVKKFTTTDDVKQMGLFTHRKKDGSLITVDITAQKFRFEDQDRVMVVCHDVTFREMESKQKKWVADIRQIFSEELLLQKTVENLLKYIIDSSPFQMGEIWLTSTDRRLLNLAATFPSNEVTTSFYVSGKEIKSYKKGMSLPGSVWESGKTEIWEKLGENKKFIRNRTAAKSGLDSAMGIPFIYNEEVIGVLLLGTVEPGRALESVKELFSSLETIIGAELKRKQLEVDYNQIFNTAPDILCVVDFESSIKRINPAGSDLLGYSEEELLNMPYIELVHPDDRDEFEGKLLNSSNDNETLRFQHRVVTRTGESLCLDWNCSKSAEQGLSYAVAKNITERIKLQSLLDEANYLARIGGWEIDLRNKKVYWSKITKEIHEVEDSFEPKLDTAINFYREDVRETVRKYVNDAIESGKPWDFELPVITGKGREVWIKSIGKVEFKNGDPVRILGSFQDIHERKMTELRLQNIADNIPGAIFQYTLHPDGSDKIEQLTKGAEELWGFTAQECMDNIDLIWNQIRQGGDFDKVAESIQRSAEKMEPWHCQFRSRLPDGSLMWHEGFGKPQKKPDGSILWDSLIIDITDQKELENLLASATEMAKIGSWEMDLRQEGNDTMFWSSMTRKILEVEESYDPSMKKGLEFYVEESRQKIKSAVEQLTKKGESFDLELLINTAKGNLKWIRCMGEAEMINDMPVKIFGSYQDINKRKVAELAVQKAFQERNTILESISDAFFAVDDNWTVTYWNHEAEVVLGTKKENIVGKNLWDVYSDAVGLDFYTQYHHAVETGEAVTFEEYYPTVEKWFEVSAYPSENGLSVYFKDITLRKISTEKIRQSNERFEVIAKATNDAIWDWDIEKGTIFHGEGYIKMFGHDNNKLKSAQDSWSEFIHPDDYEDVMNNLYDVIEDVEKENFLVEYRYLKADGTYAYVIDRGRIIRDASGKGIRMVGAMTDITERKIYEESLQNLNNVLEQHAKELARSNEELEQFAYVASHDLQEPLRMVSSFLTQLDRKYGDKLDEKARQYIDFAVDGAKNMRNIILDLLEFSKVGKSVDVKETVDVGELVDEVCMLHRKMIEFTSATVYKENLPTIKTHRGVLVQIFQNLIGNALKYRKEGVPPQITITAEESEENWVFSVQDNGIGIDEEYFEKIFIIFQRLHAKDEYEGTGMGLAIVKKIVENLGGNIRVKSKPGTGSTFTFTLSK